MIFEKVKEFIVSQLGVDEDSVTLDTNIADDLGADSLDLIELVMLLEEEFDLKVPDDEIENIKTVGDIVNYIQANQ